MASKEKEDITAVFATNGGGSEDESGSDNENEVVTMTSKVS